MDEYPLILSRIVENLTHSRPNEFKNQATEQNRIAGERFFKEEVRLYGVKAPRYKPLPGNFLTNR